MPIRDVADLLADLDRRARPVAAPRNRPLQKFQAIADTVSFSSETITTTFATPPYHWHDPAGSTATSLIWGLSEWHA